MTRVAGVAILNHRDNEPSGRKALRIGALIEAVLIAPTVLLPWGHAGPTTVGWFSFLLNAPGFFVSSRLVTLESDFTIPALVVLTFVIQAALIAGLLYLWQWLRHGRQEPGLVN